MQAIMQGECPDELRAPRGARDYRVLKMEEDEEF
jgi:hypothetical protein